MMTSPHLACSVTPLFLATFLIAYAIVFLTADLDRRREFLDIISLIFGLVIYCHWLDDFCSPDLTTHVFNHPLNSFFVIPFCVYPLSIAAVRLVIERLQIARTYWYKTIIAFTILEMLIILYVYYSVSVVASCPCLQLTQGLPLPYGTIEVDFLYVELTQFVLRWWFFYCIWRLRFIPHYGRTWSQHFVWIFMVFVGSSFALIDLFIPPTEIHALFFQAMVVYTLFEYFCVSKLYHPPSEGFSWWFTLSFFLFAMYLNIKP